MSRFKFSMVIASFLCCINPAHSESQAYCDDFVETQNLEFLWDQEKQKGVLTTREHFGCEQRDCPPKQFKLHPGITIEKQGVKTPITQVAPPMTAVGSLCLKNNKIRNILINKEGV